MPQSIFTTRYARFREMLVDARRRARLTQEQLAEKVGWTQSDISKVERGERRLDVIEFLQFAEALEVDASEFIAELSLAR